MADINNAETTTEETGRLKTFKRNKYFYGKLMTVRDFETEQSYGIEKDRLLNRLTLGVGLVCGLEVSEPKLVDGKLRINLSPGVALDCCGREIVVEGGTYEASGSPAEGTNYVYLKYKECLNERVPALSNPSACEEVCCYSRITETFELFLRTPVRRAGFFGIDTYAGRATLYWVLGQVLAKGFEVVETRFYTPTTTEFISDLTALKAQGVDVICAVGTSQNGRQIKRCLEELGFNGEFEFTEAATLTSLSPELGVHYYERCLTTCPTCTDPQVFLCAISMHASVVTVDTEITRKCRSVIYNNPMLFHLLKAHLTDLNNPHKVTALQTEALKSVDGVPNPGGNVDLVQTNAITIAPDIPNKKITIGESHSSRADNPHHVTATQTGALKSIDEVGSPGGNVDLVKKNAITIEPDITNKKIAIGESHSVRKDNPHGVTAQQVGAAAWATTDEHFLTIPVAPLELLNVSNFQLISQSSIPIEHGLVSGLPPTVMIGLVGTNGIVMEDDLISMEPKLRLEILKGAGFKYQPLVSLRALVSVNKTFNMVVTYAAPGQALPTGRTAAMPVAWESMQITIRWWAIPAQQIFHFPPWTNYVMANVEPASLSAIAAELKIPEARVSNVVDNMMKTISAQESGITLADLAKSINIKEKTITPVIDTLVQSGKIKFTGKAADRKFMLGK